MTLFTDTSPEYKAIAEDVIKKHIKHRRDGPKRTVGQREFDLTVIADLYMKGWTQTAIAEYISESEAHPYTLTRYQIRADLQELRRRWIASALVDLDARRAEELAKIDRLEAEYWKAWLESVNDYEEERIKENAEGQEITTTVRASSGDPRFLQGIQWCINRRIQIFGLDAPKKQDVRVAQVNFDLDLENMSVDELRDLRRILGKAVPDRASAGPAQET